MVTVVLAFDVDGTLNVGCPRGPIDVGILLKLKGKGFIVGVIGAFDKVPKSILDRLDFYFGGHPNKPRYLKLVVEMFKPDLILYVADEDRDREACRIASVIYVRPEDFRIPKL